MEAGQRPQRGGSHVEHRGNFCPSVRPPIRPFFRCSWELLVVRMCLRPFVLPWVSCMTVGFGVATLASIVPDLWPRETIASGSCRSRHYSSLLRVSLRFYIFYAYSAPLFSWMYSLFVSYRSFSLNRSSLRSFRMSPLMSPLVPCLSGVPVHPYTTSSLFGYFSDFCDTYGSFLFRTRPYFPQWALAHQVRVSISCLMLCRGIQRSGIGILCIFYSLWSFLFSFFSLSFVDNLELYKFGI